jgi:hypothetical protein
MDKMTEGPGILNLEIENTSIKWPARSPVSNSSMWLRIQDGASRSDIYLRVRMELRKLEKSGKVYRLYQQLHDAFTVVIS